MKKGIITFVLGVVTGVAGSFVYNNREGIKIYGQSLLKKYKGGSSVEEIPSDPTNKEQGDE